MSAPIFVAIVKTGSYPGESVSNDYVTITNNTIINWPRHAIIVANSSHVNISGNTLINMNSGTKAASKNRGVMLFDYVQATSVTNNTVVDHRPDSQVTGKLFLNSNNTTSGELTTSGNSYTADYSWTDPEVELFTSY
jgi:hypothetical protein